MFWGAVALQRVNLPWSALCAFPTPPSMWDTALGPGTAPVTENFLPGSALQGFPPFSALQESLWTPSSIGFGWD